MTPGELTGTAGVTILLLAFALNLAGKMNASSKVYLSLNVLGAGLAGLSSYLIAFWPFVVLESVWAVSSLFALVKSCRNE